MTDRTVCFGNIRSSHFSCSSLLQVGFVSIFVVLMLENVPLILLLVIGADNALGLLLLLHSLSRKDGYKLGH